MCAHIVRGGVRDERSDACANGHGLECLIFSPTAPNQRVVKAPSTGRSGAPAQRGCREVGIVSAGQVGLLRARAAHAQPSFWPPLQPRGTQPKDATRHLRGSACQRSPPARLPRRPAAPGAQARPVCRSDGESVVVRCVQADLMRRHSGCELASLGRAFHTLGRSLVEGDNDLTACSRRSMRWIFRRSATQAAVLE